MTEIPYCELTLAVTAGCTKCELGCQKCWAIRSAQRLKGKGIQGYDKVVDKNGWTGHIELMPWNLNKPLGWKKPRRIFVNSMSDLFHPEVPFEFVDKVRQVMRQCSQHTFLIFTKRPKRLYEYCEVKQRGTWPNNIQFILSLSTQAEADKKIPKLLKIPAAVRGLSLEPLLGRIKLNHIKTLERTLNALKGKSKYYVDGNTPYYGHSIGWVIIGCESLPGKKAGRFQDGFIEAARNLVGQCQAANVPIYVKQIPIKGKVSRNPKEWPKDLKIQQIRK